MATKITPNAANMQRISKDLMGAKPGSAEWKKGFEELKTAQASLTPADRASLRQAGVESMADNVAGRATQFPDKSTQLQALSDKIRQTDVSQEPTPGMGGMGGMLGGMGGLGGMFKNLSTDDRQLLMDTSPMMQGAMGGGGLGMHEAAMKTIRSIR